VPVKARPLCSSPGCSGRAEVGSRCEQHAKQARRQQRPPDTRPTSSERGYGYAWQKLRARYLAVHPCCELAGCTERSTDVDHVVSKRQGGPDEWSNLQALCHRHHSQKTVQYDGGGWRTRGRGGDQKSGDLA
jgi:5-methylcytosine-specific restriction enzyme A